jgi:cell division protein FtsQ
VSAAVARVLRAPGSVRAALPPETGRRVVMATLALTLLAALYLFVVRDSALVAVKEVHVTGLTGKDSMSIRAALEAEAEDMTTLHVRREDLVRAVEGFPVVRALDVRADFPNGLRVHVIEHHPAALIQSGSAKVPVAADGSVLRGLPAEEALPKIEARGAISADQIRDEALLGLLRVAGTAPGPLLHRAEAIARERERGIVVKLRDGPELVFGTPSRAREKWTAAAQVLADPSSQGAAYVDLRLPERPAAGGLVEEAPVTEEPAPIVEPAPTDAVVPDPAATPDPALAEPVEPVPVDPAAPVPTEPQP